MRLGDAITINSGEASLPLMAAAEKHRTQGFPATPYDPTEA